jgi:hypothetical protein
MLGLILLSKWRVGKTDSQRKGLTRVKQEEEEEEEEESCSKMAHC